ncbi:unnamed protein product [Brassica rapa]|uniref:Uncharacterized protein n=1 Tax=Brassica campestris TaxID=3711 RepID=A0A3P6BFW1_BRACM|nr:unnamed protein product [Brassica rapa]VDD04223.1 unnamed protein product [Brassica rapa]
MFITQLLPVMVMQLLLSLHLCFWVSENHHPKSYPFSIENHVDKARNRYAFIRHLISHMFLSS